MPYITYVSLSYKCVNEHLKNYKVQWKNCAGETGDTLTYS